MGGSSRELRISALDKTTALLIVVGMGVGLGAGENGLMAMLADES